MNLYIQVISRLKIDYESIILIIYNSIRDVNWVIYPENKLVDLNIVTK